MYTPGKLKMVVAAAAAWPILCNAPALAESTSVSLQMSSERNPDNFGDLLDTVYKIETAHSFDDGMFVNGFFEVQVPAESDPNKKNLEGNAGYQATLVEGLSLSLSGGLGGRFTEDDDFAYYVVRVGGTVAITEWLSWNIVTFRYRDSFHADDDYKTPRLTTKAVIQLDESNDIYGELYRNYNWDWDTTANAFALGYSHRF
jgi:hypothetical protein